MKVKLKKALLGVMAFSFVFSMNAFVASSSFNANYYTAGGAGAVSGKTNGIFHYLDSGNAYLNTTYASHVCKCTLYKSGVGFDTSYGEVNTSGRQRFPKAVTASSNYYLVFDGGPAMTNISVRGTLTN